MSRLIESTESTIVDEFGNTKEQKKVIVKRYEDEPNYIKVYLDTILYLSDIPKGYNSILLAFLKHMTYASFENNQQGQLIYVNSAMKKNIASEIGVSLPRINQSLTDFVKGKIFYRVDRGTYRVNPHLFGKGQWDDIKDIRLSIDFNPKGTTMMSEIKSLDKADLKLVK